MSDHVCVVALRLQRGPQAIHPTLSLLNTHSRGPNTRQGRANSSERESYPCCGAQSPVGRQTINQSVRPTAHQLAVSAMETRKQGRQGPSKGDIRMNS